jgi:hypothetical protein
MKTQIIQLESHDDLISTRDKMAWSKAPRILLVWPRKGRILERSVDLLILQRHALTLGAQLGVVTSSGEVRANARDLGVPSFSSPVEAQRGSWRRPRNLRRINWRKYRRKVDIHNLRDQREEFKPVNYEVTWMRVIAFGAGVLAVLALVAFFLPSARVELSPARKEQTLQLELWANPKLSAANPSGGLPATQLSVVVEGSQQAPSGGKVAIPDKQAEGSVQFSNLGEDPVNLPAGTVVLAQGSSPLRFETTSAATVPGGAGKQAIVPVRAVLPGTGGNVPTGVIQTVEGDAGLQVLVNNPTAMHGGSDRYSPGPLPQDYARLKEQLLASLSQTALAELSAKLSGGQRLLDGTLRAANVQKEVMEPPVGEPGDFARLSMQVEYSVWYVMETDLQAVATTALEANRPAGFTPLGESLQVTFQPGMTYDADGTARWKANASWQLDAGWSNDQAARELAGRSPEEAGRLLEQNLPLASPPRISIFPPWWLRMPFLPFRIEVVRQ